MKTDASAGATTCSPMVAKASPATAPGRPRCWPVVRWFLRKIERLLAVIGLGMVAYHLLFDVSVIVSGSMKPTLQGENAEEGDWVLTERVTFALRSPRRWEVITFRKKDGMQIMKRVVGLPGEAVAVKDGRPVVGGELELRPESLDFLHYYGYGKLRKGREAECGDGYFVLGDDSVDSLDSRYEGPVSPDTIVGRAWLRVWPPERIGFVNP